MKYKKAVKMSKWNFYVTSVVFVLIDYTRCGYLNDTIAIIVSILFASIVVTIIVV